MKSLSWTKDFIVPMECWRVSRVLQLVISSKRHLRTMHIYVCGWFWRTDWEYRVHWWESLMGTCTCTDRWCWIILLLVVILRSRLMVCSPHFHATHALPVSGEYNCNGIIWKLFGDVWVNDSEFSVRRFCPCVWVAQNCMDFPLLRTLCYTVWTMGGGKATTGEIKHELFLSYKDSTGAGKRKK